MDDESKLSTDDIERARGLILRGSRADAGSDRYQEEILLVDRYFASLKGSDLNAALASFEYAARRPRSRAAANAPTVGAPDGPEPSQRQVAAKLLIAYILWAWSRGQELVPGGETIERFVSRFTQIAFVRLLGFESTFEWREGEEASELGGVLRDWQSPDMAFGWKKKPGRPPLGIDGDLRNIAIAAHVELLRREGYPPKVQYRQTAAKFRVGVPTVEKVSSLGPHEIASFGEQFNLLSKEALSAFVHYVTALPEAQGPEKI